MVQFLSKAAAGRLRKFHLVFASVLACANAFGFDMYPEYSGPTRYDVERWLLPSQYKHDLMSNPFTFLWPDDNDASYLAQTMAENSVYAHKYNSPAQFWWPTQYRATMRDYLAGGIVFQYSPYIQQDVENDQQRNILELRMKYDNHFSFAVFADPTFYNSGTQVGGALIVRTSDNHEVRLFGSRHGFVGNADPMTTGLFSDGASQSFGFAGGTPYRNEAYMWMSDQYYDYFLRADLPHDYYDEKSYTGMPHLRYANYTGGFSNSEKFNRVRFSQRLQYSTEFQEQGTGEVMQQGLDTRKLQGLLNLSLPLTLPFSRFNRWELEGGLGFYQRDWKNEQENSAHNFNLFPTLWVKWWAYHGAHAHQLWKFGYVTTHSFFWGNKDVLAGMSPYEVVREYTFVLEQKFSEQYKITWSFNRRPGVLRYLSSTLQVERKFF